MSDLKHLRSKLDAIDEEVIALIAKRLDLVSEVIKVKSKKSDAIKDPAREREVMARIEKIARDHNLSGPFAKKLFRDIMNYSLAEEARQLGETDAEKKGKQARLTVAFQGVENAYSHLAGQAYFAGRAAHVHFTGFRTFKEAITTLQIGAADYAILPIENTTAGSINEVYDLLLESGVFIVGEEIWKVEHCLIGFADTPLEKLTRVLSHPQALGQCSNFLTGLRNASIDGFFDTAEAVKKVAEDKDARQAAVGSVEAAEAWGLSILARNIANQEENYTRFVVLARAPQSYDVRIPCKTSLALSTRHEKGALLKCLDVLAKHDLSMTKLESRPRPHRPWEYLFYLDFEGNIADARVAKGLDELKGRTLFLKVLGSYPARALAEEAMISTTQEAGAVAEPQPQEEPAPVAAPAVAKSKHYKLVSRDHRAEDTLIRVGNLLIGGDGFVVMAGPCSVESEEQIAKTAKFVKEHGAHILRGGVFKPRTSPYSFQGLGLDGLNLLREAGHHYGLPVVTEVMTLEAVKPIAEKSDILQIGARNMQNFPLLREVGKVDKPVLLKRGLMATLEELLAAAEYILSQGNGQVILCERGIRTFETSTRNTLDLTAVPVLKELTHLPVIVDPSHGTGKSRYVTPMALAGRVVGAHGLMIEVHPDPAQALSDGDQSLSFPEFAELMRRLRRVKV